MVVGDAPGGWKPWKTEIFTPQFTALLLHSGCESAAGKQTGVWYVFRVFWGSIFEQVRMGDAPGG